MVYKGNPSSYEERASEKIPFQFWIEAGISCQRTDIWKGQALGSYVEETVDPIGYDRWNANVDAVEVLGKPAEDATYRLGVEEGHWSTEDPLDAGGM